MSMYVTKSKQISYLFICKGPIAQRLCNLFFDNNQVGSARFLRRASASFLRLSRRS